MEMESRCFICVSVEADGKDWRENKLRDDLLLKRKKWVSLLSIGKIRLQLVAFLADGQLSLPPEHMSENRLRSPRGSRLALYNSQRKRTQRDAQPKRT